MVFSKLRACFFLFLLFLFGNVFYFIFFAELLLQEHLKLGEKSWVFGYFPCQQIESTHLLVDGPVNPCKVIRKDAINLLTAHCQRSQIIINHKKNNIIRLLNGLWLQIIFWKKMFGVLLDCLFILHMKLASLPLAFTLLGCLIELINAFVSIPGTDTFVNMNQ